MTVCYLAHIERRALRCRPPDEPLEVLRVKSNCLCTTSFNLFRLDELGDHVFQIVVICPIFHPFYRCISEESAGFVKSFEKNFFKTGHNPYNAGRQFGAQRAFPALEVRQVGRRDTGFPGEGSVGQLVIFLEG